MAEEEKQTPEDEPKRRRRPARRKKADEAPPEETPKTEAEAEPVQEEPEEKAEAGEPEEAPKPAPRRAPVKRDVAEVRAKAKYVRTSARKARLVCDHIRGKSVGEARAILAHTPRAVARDWSKLLESAVANAEHNHELDGDELRIAVANADEGPTLKRFQPRAMGRASRIRKRTAHLSITLAPVMTAPKPARGKAKSKTKGKS